MKEWLTTKPYSDTEPAETPQSTSRGPESLVKVRELKEKFETIIRLRSLASIEKEKFNLRRLPNKADIFEALGLGDQGSNPNSGRSMTKWVEFEDPGGKFNSVAFSHVKAGSGLGIYDLNVAPRGQEETAPLLIARLDYSHNTEGMIAVRPDMEDVALAGIGSIEELFRDTEAQYYPNPKKSTDGVAAFISAIKI